MKKTVLLGLYAAFAAPLCVCPVPVAAQESIEPQTGTPQTGTPQTGTPQNGGEKTEFANPGAPIETLNYEQIRQLYRVQTFTTPAGARANVASLAGSIVEMQGDVSGTMSSSKGRVFIMKIDDALATFSVAPKFRNFDVMRSGKRARVLVEVGDDAGFSIVAATPQLVSYGNANGNADGNADGSGISQSASAATITTDNGNKPKDGIDFQDFQGANSDVIVMSPMTTMTTPQGMRPQVAAPSPQVFSSGTPLRGNTTSSGGTIVGRSASRALTNALPAAKSSDSRMQSLVDEQKPAYKALVRRHNARLTEDQVEEIASALLGAGVKNNLDPRFLAAIISVESDFDIKCTSSSGAQGLGQLMPFNSRDLGIRNPYNPTENIYGTAKLLRGHLDDFNRFGARGPLLAVAAYNAGPNAVKRAGNNVPSGAQVQRYVWKVYARYKEFAPDMFK